MPCSIYSKNQAVVIAIDGIMHMAFNRSQLVHIQSWVKDMQKTIFCIELSFKEGEPMICEYDNREKWKEILNLLEGENVFAEKLY